MPTPQTKKYQRISLEKPESGTENLTNMAAALMRLSQKVSDKRTPLWEAKPVNRPAEPPNDVRKPQTNQEVLPTRFFRQSSRFYSINTTMPKLPRKVHILLTQCGSALKLLTVFLPNE
jgi:hypothetical protein